jgi:hypothetical protein
MAAIRDPGSRARLAISVRLLVRFAKQGGLIRITTQRVEKLPGARVRVADQGVLTSFEYPFRGVWAARTRIDALRIHFFNTLNSYLTTLSD